MVNGKKLLASILVGAMVITGSPVAPAWNVASVEAAEAKTTLAISTGAGSSIYNAEVTSPAVETANASVTKDSTLTLKANANVLTSDLTNYKSDAVVNYVWTVGEDATKTQYGATFNYVATGTGSVTAKLTVTATYVDENGITKSQKIKEVDVTITTTNKKVTTADITVPSFKEVYELKDAAGSTIAADLTAQIDNSKNLNYGNWEIDATNLTNSSTEATAVFTANMVSGYTVDTTDAKWVKDGSVYKYTVKVPVKVVEVEKKSNAVAIYKDGVDAESSITLKNGSTVAAENSVTLMATGTDAAGYTWTVTGDGVSYTTSDVAGIKNNQITIKATAATKTEKPVVVKVQPTNGNATDKIDIAVQQVITESEAFTGVSFADVVYDAAKTGTTGGDSCYWSTPKATKYGTYTITKVQNYEYNSNTGKYVANDLALTVGNKLITVTFAAAATVDGVAQVTSTGSAYEKTFVANVAKKEITPEFPELANAEGKFSAGVQLQNIVKAMASNDGVVEYKWKVKNSAGTWTDIAKTTALTAGVASADYKLVATVAAGSTATAGIKAGAVTEKTYNFTVGKTKAISAVSVNGGTTYIQQKTDITLTAVATNDATSVFDTKYQWYKDGAAIDGATTNTYSVTKVDQSGVYYCVATPAARTTATAADVAAYDTEAATSNKVEVSKIAGEAVAFTPSVAISDTTYGKAATMTASVTGDITSWSYEIKDADGKVVDSNSYSTAANGTIALKVTAPATLPVADGYKIYYTVNYNAVVDGKTVAQTTKSQGYAFKVAKATLTIDNAKVSVGNIAYGDAVSAAKVTYVDNADDAKKAYAEIINQNVTFTINDTTTPKAGPYTIAAGKIAYKLSDAAAKNYTLTAGTVGATKAIVVDKKVVTVTADDVTIEDGKDIAAALTSKQDVEAAKTTVTYKVTDKDGKEVDLKNVEVGTYTVTPVVKLDDIDNYNVAVKAGTLTVTEHKHDFEEEVITKATTTTEGVVKKTCKICGEVVVEKTAKLPKKAQSITTTKLSASYKVATVKKAAKYFSIGAKCTSKTAVTAKKVSGSKKITVSSTGKVKIAKGTKKGTYTAKVKLSAKSTSSYKAATKTVKVTVKVK